MKTFILKAGTGLMQPCTSLLVSLSTPHRRLHGELSHLYIHYSLEFTLYVRRNSLKILNICIGKSKNCIDSRRPAGRLENVIKRPTKVDEKRPDMSMLVVV